MSRIWRIRPELQPASPFFVRLWNIIYCSSLTNLSKIIFTIFMNIAHACKDCLVQASLSTINYTVEIISYFIVQIFSYEDMLMISVLLELSLKTDPRSWGFTGEWWDHTAYICTVTIITSTQQLEQSVRQCDSTGQYTGGQQQILPGSHWEHIRAVRNEDVRYVGFLWSCWRCMTGGSDISCIVGKIFPGKWKIFLIRWEIIFQDTLRNNGGRQ